MAVNVAGSPAWQRLERHAHGLRGQHLRDLFAADPLRFQRLSVRWSQGNDWLLDLSKQRITPETLPLLAELWNTADVPGWIAKMRAGAPINHTEGRAVLHVALRNLGEADGPIFVDDRDVMPDVRAVLKQMRGFCDAIHSGR